MSVGTSAKERLRRFKPYPAYKDSGVEWLGEIPLGWRLQPLWAMYRRVKRTGYPHDQLLSVYRDFGVIPTASRDDNFNRPSEDLSTYQLVDKRDLVTNKMKTWQGSIAISDYRGIVSPAYHVHTPTHSESDRYLHHLVRSSPYVSGYMQMSKGIRVNQWDLEPEAFSRILVLLPSRDEQRTIAAFLDRETARIDALVAKKERLIELLQEKRTALITRAVTKGLDPNVPMKDSGVDWLGKIPEHWEAARMWCISSAASGGTPAKEERGYWDGNIPWVSPKDMKKRLVESSEDTITERALVESGLKLIDPPAVLIVVRGMILAHTFRVAITRVPVTINQDMKALRFRKGVDPIFMAWLFEGIGKGLLAAVVEEAAHGTRAIRMDQWRSVTVPIPAVQEQRTIIEFLDRETAKIDALVAEVQDAIDRLKELRTTLISAAVTGKIDVREEVA